MKVKFNKSLLWEHIYDDLANRGFFINRLIARLANQAVINELIDWLIAFEEVKFRWFVSSSRGFEKYFISFNCIQFYICNCWWSNDSIRLDQPAAFRLNPFQYACKSTELKKKIAYAIKRNEVQKVNKNMNDFISNCNCRSLWCCHENKNYMITFNANSNTFHFTLNTFRGKNMLKDIYYLWLHLLCCFFEWSWIKNNVNCVIVLFKERRVY